MSYKVIFDTNSIRNAESVTDFLGGRADLERFYKVSEIIIPDMVIEEIKHQKKKHLVAKRDSFLSNPFHFLRGIKKQETQDFDIENCIIGLMEGETIRYSIITLTKTSVLEEMKWLSLRNEPPFDKESDKGFKDAYIYYTILEYLENCEDERIFLVTKDDRLRCAFADNARIIIIKDFSEFEKYADAYFKEEYFVNRLKEEINERIKPEDVKEFWLNTEGTWTLLIICEGKESFVEVDFDSREIIDSTDFVFSDYLVQLIISSNFQTTHTLIGVLNEYKKYFSDQQISSLIKAATENSQIYAIATDEDVMEFFNSIYEAKFQIISNELKEIFEKYFLSKAL